MQDQNELKRKNAKLTDYYENLRTNVFSIFGSSTQNYSDSYLGLFVSEIQLFVLSSPTQKENYNISRKQNNAEGSGGRQHEPGEVRQLPHQAPEHLHRERGGGGEAGVRDHEVSHTEHVGVADCNVMIDTEREEGGGVTLLSLICAS